MEPELPIEEGNVRNLWGAVVLNIVEGIALREQSPYGATDDQPEGLCSFSPMSSASGLR